MMVEQNKGLEQTTKFKSLVYYLRQHKRLYMLFIDSAQTLILNLSEQKKQLQMHHFIPSEY